MKTVTDAGNGNGAPAMFARNQLVIAVPKGNPKGIAGLADLTKPDLKLALCAVQVPCGAAAKTALAAAGVTAHSGHPGTGRQGGTVQTEARRGRRRARLPDRREGGDGRCGRYRVPRIGWCDQRVSDRRPQGRSQSRPALRRSSPTCARSRARPCLTQAGFQAP